MENSINCPGIDIKKKDCKEVCQMDLPMYGRDKEMRILLESYESSGNNFQVIWIYGSSGVGKSTLVTHCFQDKDNFCVGKFDIIPSSKPYSTIIRVLSSLIGILRSNAFPKVTVSPDVARSLTNLIPSVVNVLLYENIEGISSSQHFGILESKVDEWGFQRLKQAIKSFVKKTCEILLACSSSPLIFYLDDLQWCDASSLDIIGHLLSGGDKWNGFMFIGSFRDNEIAEDSSLMHCKETTEKSNCSVKNIHLKNLIFEDVKQLIADVTNSPSSPLEPLTTLVFEKTLGNPFYIKSSIRYMKEKQILQYSASEALWYWNESQVFADIGSSGINAITMVLCLLPFTNLECLKIASCLGSEVDISLLFRILSSLDLAISKEIFQEIIQDAVSRQLIVQDTGNDYFCFAYDQIQEACYQLVGPVESQECMHLKIGRLLLLLELEDDNSFYSENNLLIVDQLNRGFSLMETDKEKLKLAKLNLMAAEELIAASAFKMAQNILNKVISLIGDKGWTSYYDWTISAHFLLANASFANGSMKQALFHVNEICRESKSEDDCIKAQILKLEILSCKSKIDECIELSFQLLNNLGHSKLSRNPGLKNILWSFFRVKQLMRKMSDDAILNLPQCCDTKVLTIFKIMAILGLVAVYGGNDFLLPVITCQMIELSIKYGVNEFSSYVFSSFAFALTMTEDFDEAFRFGSLALQLMNRFCEDPKTLVIVYGLFYHIKKPILDAVDPSLNAYYLAFTLGDVAFAGQAISSHIILRYVAGSQLGIIVEDIFSFCDQLKSFNQKMAWDILLILQRSCLELTGRSEEISRLTGQIFDDNSFVGHLKESSAKGAILQLSLHTLSSRFYLGDIESALKFAKVCWQLNGLQGAFPLSIDYFLFSALIALEFWKAGNPLSRHRFWVIFRKHHRRLRSWTTKGNPNTRHLVNLLDAEFSVTKKNACLDNIKASYDLSIAQASRAGFLQHAALANERVGEFFMKRGDMYWAQHYLGRAKYLYTDWGAMAKVSQMQIKFGSMIETGVPDFNLSVPIAGRSRLDMVAQVNTLRNRNTLLSRPSSI